MGWSWRKKCSTWDEGRRARRTLDLPESVVHRLLRQVWSSACAGHYTQPFLADTLVSSSESSTSQSPVYSLFNRFNSETKRLLIGPTLRVETQSGIGFEVDALYQRVDSDFSALLLQPLAPAQQTFQQTTANRWQFPVLLQYSRKLRSMRWFAGAGPSLSHISQNRPQITGSSLFGSVPSSATWGGITAGGGVDVRISHLHLRPEFRYSHWFAGSGAVTPSAAVVFSPHCRLEHPPDNFLSLTVSSFPSTKRKRAFSWE